MAMQKNRYPHRWDSERVKALISHYEDQAAMEATAEDDAAFAKRTYTVMKVPLKLVPRFRAMIAKVS